MCKLLTKHGSIWIKTTLFLVPLLPAATVAMASPDISARADFARYAIIIDRAPFGKPEELPPPTNIVVVVVSPEDLNRLKSIRLAGMTLDGDRVELVGLVDDAAKKPYLLKPGDSEDGITVVSADAATWAVTIRVGSTEQTMVMQSPSGKPVEANGVVLPSAGNTKLLPERQLSPAERRKRLQDATDERLRKAAEAQSKIPPEVMERHLQNYNDYLIRSKGENGPPLPIQLTEEIDNRLVADGFLPPRQQFDNSVTSN